MQLIPVDSFDTLEQAYQIYQSNNSYFSKFAGFPPTKDDVIEDRIFLPRNTNFTQKKYALIEYKKAIIGVVDIIHHYPDMDTNYINLLMFDEKYQNQQYGTYFLKYLSHEFKKEGCKKIKASVSSKESLKFWQKNSFVISKNKVEDLLMLEKKLVY